METLTLSRLADLIIVFSFAGVFAAAAGTLAADVIIFIVKKIRKAHEKRRAEKQ